MLSNVVPIPKQKSLVDVSNLRPISLLPLPGRLLEKIVCARLTTYLERNTKLNPLQLGFRKGHSTQTAISVLLNDIYNNIDDRKTTYTVFLDLQKAFDTVSHPILLCKLSGIGTCSVDWFQSYLTQREQRVNLDSLGLCQIMNIDNGVPQGSIL